MVMNKACLRMKFGSGNADQEKKKKKFAWVKQMKHTIYAITLSLK